MDHKTIQISRFSLLALLAFTLLAGCLSPSQEGARRRSLAPVATRKSPIQSPTSTRQEQCGSSAQNGQAPPLVLLDSYSFHPGHDVGFTGTGFQPGEAVDVTLGNLKSDPQSQNNQMLTTAHANTAGDLTGKAHVPMMSPGTFHLYFTGEQCTGPLTVNIILLPFTPWVVLDNYAPPPHYLLGFQGHDFAPGEPVQVYLNQQNTTPVAQAQADNSGQFAVNQAWNVGDLTGDNTLLFVGTYTKLVVSVHFEVLVLPPTPPPNTPPSPAGSSGPTGFVGAESFRINARSTLAPLAAAPKNSGNGFSFITADPLVMVLALLLIWLAFCLILALSLSVERFPRWRSMKRRSERSEAPGWQPKKYACVPTPGLRVSSRAERGQARADEEKEDAFLTMTGIRSEQGQLQPFALCVVTDSVGYYANGQTAGERAIHTILQLLVPGLLREDLLNADLRFHLESALQGANRLLYGRNQRENANTSCSVTAALVSRNEANICSIGASRAYFLPSQASLRRVATDHSIIERHLAGGAVQRDVGPPHLRRNRLYRSLGQHPEARVDTFRLPVGLGDQLLLCSDGLWGMFSDPDLETMMRQSPDVTLISNTLIEQAKARGSFDNVTAIMMRLVEATPFTLQPGIDNISTGSTHSFRRHVSWDLGKALQARSLTLPLPC